ncbi:MAG: hypothetical protein JST48_12770 [Bacteroidetes bacterium]|nr:hypothetical protein [Bacteroidota bacterium]
MNRKLQALFVGVFVLFLLNTAQAQDDEGEIQKVEIEIIKNKQVSVPKASRNFEKIPPRAAEPIKPEITYQYKNLPFHVPDFNPAIRPLRLKAEPLSKIYSNYISAGFGNYSSPYAEAYITNKRSKNKYYGAKFFHRSFMNGPVDADNSASGNTELRLFGKAMSEKVALDGFVNYENTTTHFYGYRPGQDVSASSIRQSYNIVSAGSKLENAKTSDLSYQLVAGYSYLSDHFAASESEINLNWASAYKISKKNRIVINSDYFLIDRKDSMVPSHTRQIFKVKPAFEFSSIDKLTVLVGANMTYENDTIGNQNKIHVYPNIKADYSVSPSVNVYAGLTGDIDKVSLHSLSRENVWINSNIAIFNTNRALEFFGGLQGKISSKVYAGAGLSVSTLKNFYYYQSDTGATQRAKFNTAYDNGNTVRTQFFGELGYSGKTFKINSRIDYWAYSSSIANQIASLYLLGKTFASGALQRPSYRYSINSSYNIYDKLLLQVDFIAQGGIKALDRETKSLTSLKAALDLNAKVNYFVSNQFSVFLNFNNIFASNYQLYLNYPVRGFQVMGGASWSF